MKTSRACAVTLVCQLGEFFGVFNFTKKNPYGECLGGFSGMGVRTPMQDYKSLRVAVTISTTLVNTHTDTQTHLYTISSPS